MTGRLVRREALTAAERDAMYALLDAHFEGVSRAQFERDLAEKGWALLLEEDGWFAGFSTLAVYESTASPEPATVVYSGDTIVERDAQGRAALPAAWIAAVRALTEGRRGRIWWLLLTSGFRTYRFLPVFWREFWPRWDAPEPPALLDALARERLGPAYLPDLGIARLPAPQALRPELREVSAGRLADPHVAFFLDRNPGWAQGDELVCLTEIAASNLTPAGRRMWTRGRVTAPQSFSPSPGAGEGSWERGPEGEGS